MKRNEVEEPPIDWLMEGKVQKLVVVVEGVKSKDILERWVFNIEQEGGGDQETNQEA